MVKVKVKLRKSTVEGKAGVIYYQLCHKRQSRQITTGIRLFPDQWDARRERVMVSLAGRDAATAVVQRQIDGDLCLLRAIVGDFEARREEYGLPEPDLETLRSRPENLMVTPQDIDQQVRDLGKVIGYGINWALQDLEIEEINALLS